MPDPAGSSSPLDRLLLERRVVFVGGDVDAVKAGDIAASLMTLDALGDDPVELRLNA